MLKTVFVKLNQYLFFRLLYPRFESTKTLCLLSGSSAGHQTGPSWPWRRATVRSTSTTRTASSSIRSSHKNCPEEMPATVFNIRTPEFSSPRSESSLGIGSSSWSSSITREGSTVSCCRRRAIRSELVNLFWPFLKAKCNKAK